MYNYYTILDITVHLGQWHKVQFIHKYNFTM